MRATEIIRGVLDLIDQVENSDQIDQESTLAHQPVEEPVQTGVDTNRFKQIFDILSAERDQMYDNSPDPVVAGIESVTVHAGGGWNGPKNPADLRSDSVSLYPNHIHKPGV
jgi:hypothetical protein